MVLYAKDIVERGFRSVPAGTSVLEAARRMRDGRHGFVIVATAEGEPAGSRRSGISSSTSERRTAIRRPSASKRS